MKITLFKNAIFTKSYDRVCMEETRLLTRLAQYTKIEIEISNVYFSFNGSFHLKMPYVPSYEIREYNYAMATLDNNDPSIANKVYFFIDNIENMGVDGLATLHYTLDVWHSNIRKGIKLHYSPLRSCSDKYDDSKLPVESLPSGDLNYEKQVTPPTANYRLFATLSFYTVQQAGVVSERFTNSGWILVKTHGASGNPSALLGDSTMNDIIKILKYHMSSTEQFENLSTQEQYYYDIIDIKILPDFTASITPANFTAVLENVSIPTVSTNYDIYYQASLHTYSISDTITLQSAYYNFNYAYGSYYRTAMYYGLFGYLKKCKQDCASHYFKLKMACEENMWHIYFEDEDGIVDISSLFEYKDGIVPESAVALANERLGRLTSTIGSVTQTIGGTIMAGVGIGTGNVTGGVVGASQAVGGLAGIIQTQLTPHVSSTASAIRSLSPYINAKNGLIVVWNRAINESEVAYAVRFSGFLTDNYINALPVPTLNNDEIAISFKMAYVYGVCQDDVTILKQILERGTILIY